MADRVNVDTFALANPLYSCATVTAWVAVSGAKTTTLATLYESLVGTATLANPQTLDSDGKFLQAVYAESDVILEVTGASVPDHDTGVIQVPTSDVDTITYFGRAGYMTGYWATKVRKWVRFNFLKLTGGTMSGAIQMANNLINNIQLGRTYEQSNAVSSSSNTTTINANNNANAFTTTLSENTTLAFSGIPASGYNWSAVFVAAQPSGQAYTIAFPAACVDTAGAALSPITVTADTSNVLVFWSIDGGTTIVVSTYAEGI